MIVGYHDVMDLMLEDFEAYVAPGSQLLAIPGMSSDEYHKRTAMVDLIIIFILLSSSSSC